MDQATILNSQRLPGRLDVQTTAQLLGFASHDLPILIRLKLLVPLGKPPANSPKYFASCEILRLVEDRDWLHKATKAVSLHWQAKHSRVQKGKESIYAKSEDRRAA